MFDDSWIREQQLFWFAIDSKNEQPHFYTPAIEEGYTKDTHWKPSISKKDLLKELP